MRMPAEWEPHERTLMGWPCRRAAVGRAARAGARGLRRRRQRDRPVRAGDDDRGRRRRRRAGPGTRAHDGVDVVELPLDDSWLRDCGPIYVYDADGTRGSRSISASTPGARSSRRGIATREVGGRDRRRLSATRSRPRRSCSRAARSSATATGRCSMTEQCLLHPNRNPSLSREQIEHALRDSLGVRVGSSGWGWAWSRIATPTVTST